MPLKPEIAGGGLNEYHVIAVDVMEAVAPIGSIRKRDVGAVLKTAVTSIAKSAGVNFEVYR